jgi:hypothetical protein
LIELVRLINKSSSGMLDALGALGVIALVIYPLDMETRLPVY